jgi:hypothetical protein
MPLFPYFPVIVWVGMIKIMLDMAHDDDALGINDSTGLSANSASIVPFPTPLARAVVLR